MENVIGWFEAYRIDHKISWANNTPVRVDPIGKLSLHKNGKNWFCNGRVVSRKFVCALQAYYA